MSRGILWGSGALVFYERSKWAMTIPAVKTFGFGKSLGASGQESGAKRLLVTDIFSDYTDAVSFDGASNPRWVDLATQEGVAVFEQAEGKIQPPGNSASTDVALSLQLASEVKGSKAWVGGSAQARPNLTFVLYQNAVASPIPIATCTGGRCKHTGTAYLPL